MYYPCVKVDIRPFKPEYFATSETAEQCELEESTILHGSFGLIENIKELFRLFKCKHLVFFLGYLRDNRIFARSEW